MLCNTEIFTDAQFEAVSPPLADQKAPVDWDGPIDPWGTPAEIGLTVMLLQHAFDVYWYFLSVGNTEDATGMLDAMAEVFAMRLDPEPLHF